MNSRERRALTIVTIMRRRSLELQLARGSESRPCPAVSADAHRAIAEGLEYAAKVIRMTDYEQAEERRVIDQDLKDE